MTLVWRRIAERYRSERAVLAYELLNEPIAPYNDWKKYNDALEPLYKRVIAAIRAVDPDHVIVLGGAQWNTEFGIFGPPFAPNLMYTFHKYWSEVTDASIAAVHVVPRALRRADLAGGNRGEHRRVDCRHARRWQRRTGSGGRSGRTRRWTLRARSSRSNGLPGGTR